MQGILSESDSGYIRVVINNLIEEKKRPFHMLADHCRIFPEGNQWCILYGDNVQEGVTGFGDTPIAASFDFDNNWYNAKAGEPA